VAPTISQGKRLAVICGINGKKGNKLEHFTSNQGGEPGDVPQEKKASPTRRFLKEGLCRVSLPPEGEQDLHDTTKRRDRHKNVQPPAGGGRGLREKSLWGKLLSSKVRIIEKDPDPQKGEEHDAPNSGFGRKDRMKGYQRSGVRFGGRRGESRLGEEEVPKRVTGQWFTPTGRVGRRRGEGRAAYKRG